MSSLTAQIPSPFLAFFLHAKQLMQPEKFRASSEIGSVSAPPEAAPSNAFFSNVMVF